MILAEWSTKIRIAVALAAMLLVVIGLGLFFMLQKDDDQASKIDNALTLAEEKTNMGDYDQALGALKQVENQAQTTEQKLRVLSNLAAAAANAGQLSEAVGYYDKKHQLAPDTVASDGYLVGELYERLGETKKAIEQFELYLEHLKANPTEENAGARVNSLSARIEQMKEGL